jgi:hypothetical protein
MNTATLAMPVFINVVTLIHDGFSASVAAHRVIPPIARGGKPQGWWLRPSLHTSVAPHLTGAFACISYLRQGIQKVPPRRPMQRAECVVEPNSLIIASRKTFMIGNEVGAELFAYLQFLGQPTSERADGKLGALWVVVQRIENREATIFLPGESCRISN